ncbi:MAG: PQQ-dependent sugar dehydrogenase [Gammaproteobacteria bacterium]|nr:PQQ-dependent sugar dehydrogenase [Gammaproteobacteria bacterium]
MPYRVRRRARLPVPRRPRRHGQRPDLGTHHAGVIRPGRDGSVPDGNPFVDRAGARPELFTLGNRNPQGMTRHPAPALSGRSNTGRRAATS